MKKDKNHRSFKSMDPDIIKRLLSLPKKQGIELFKRVSHRYYLEKDNILNQAFEEKIFTKKEYNEKYKDMFYDKYGSDSFIQYINAVMNSDVDCFVTENIRMMKRKKELFEKFGLRIASPEEIVKENDKT